MTVGETLRAGSLCTGYGGLDMAVEAVLGTEFAWVADNAPVPAQILAHRYPDVPNLGDITQADWATAPAVNVICTGFPCKDVSTAGWRAGLRAGTRSGVWAHCARAIAVLRPSLVVIENVKGLRSAGADSNVEWCPWCMGEAGPEHLVRALGAVLGDLAGLGYDTQWVSVRADDAGAPHERERVFILGQTAADPLGDLVQRPGVPGVLGGTKQAAAGVLVEREAPERQRQRDGHATADRDQATAEGVSAGFGWREYAPPLRRWEAILGRPAPWPVEPGSDDLVNPQFVEWMMGLPAGWVTDVPGLSREQKLRALGEGVVPQQAELALRLLMAESASAVLREVPA